MSPSLDGQIRLGLEANAEDDNREEAGDVARQLPVLPLASLTRWWWGPIEEVALWSFLVAWSGPSARTSGTTSSGSEARH